MDDPSKLWKVHQEPREMRQRFTELESCIDCRKPTSFWLIDKHTPLCQFCAEKRKQNFEATGKIK